ncbi:MAG: HAD-IB family phosphatase [Candidatus Saccharibacteria bacterium]
MAQAREQLVIPDGIIVADPTNFEEKLAEFAVVGAAGMHAIFDFDRTLTVKKPESQDEVTTWHILREHLPEDGQVEYQKLFEKYRALEIRGEMSQGDAVEWWSSILNLFVEHKIDLGAVEETFLDRASIRLGTVELFQLFADSDIPTIILSAGIREVIDIWCRKYGIKPSLVLSTALTLDGENKISGWQEDTLVHVLNKSESTHPELSAIRADRPKALLVGDSLDDASMAAGEGDVIRVRILDPRVDETATEQEERKTFEKFDALIKSGDLHPLERLVEIII